MTLTDNSKLPGRFEVSGRNLPEVLDKVAAGELGKRAARDLTDWSLSHAAAARGAKGGQAKSAAKTEANREKARARWAKVKAASDGTRNASDGPPELPTEL